MIQVTRVTPDCHSIQCTQKFPRCLWGKVLGGERLVVPLHADHTHPPSFLCTLRRNETHYTQAFPGQQAPRTLRRAAAAFLRRKNHRKRSGERGSFIGQNCRENRKDRQKGSPNNAPPSNHCDWQIGMPVCLSPPITDHDLHAGVRAVALAWGR